ncbi:MAG: radical SAM protein, partial [Planctomycetota bacterium]
MKNRREFIKKALAGCAAGSLFFASRVGSEESAEGEGEQVIPGNWVEAKHYEKKEDLKVHCLLCPRECSVADRERGYCGVRENRSGKYYTLVHSRPCSIHVDPVEKKPLYHFKPGHTAFSLATVGCNIECKFCQNWEISQFTPEQRPSFDMPPSELVSQAIRKGCWSIAYT